MDLSSSFLDLSVSADLSSPSPGLVSPSAAAASVPSAVSPSASTGFSGSLTIVGAATVAITKSLPCIVGETFSGKLIDEIFILVPISKPSRSVSYTHLRAHET